MQTSTTKSNALSIAENPPRNPEEIAPTQHFLRRFSNKHGSSCETRRNPEITGEIIETCIVDGDISTGNGRSLLYETEIDGYDWRLVVGFEHGAPVAVTAYCPTVHRPCNQGGRDD